MTCREEILAAVDAVVGRSGISTFALEDVIREMHRRGTRYPDSTIRTHIVSAMCVNAPPNHAHRTPDLLRVEHGLYQRWKSSATGGPQVRPNDGRASSRGTTRLVGVSPEELQSLFSSYSSMRSPGARYASFDYCYNHFQQARESGDVANLASGSVLETSCLQLGFYLASWGMLRGSTELLQHSLQSLVPVVRLIASELPSSWELDVDVYENRLDDVLGLCERVRKALPGTASDTLVTKVVLGVFGAVPAFDQFFRRGFGGWQYGPRSLQAVGEFYRQHRGIIAGLPVVHTLDFATGADTERVYPKAKVLDMIFFERGRLRTRSTQVA